MKARGMQRRGPGNIALLLASVLVSLLVAEVALRYILPADMSSSWAMRVPHPERGWALQPGANYRYRLPSALVEVSHNSRGFHDGEHVPENPGGIPRVVVLGDSFMEAFSVGDGEAFHVHLAGALAQAGRPAEVINLGVGGYGTLQEYLTYLSEGRRYRPDIVLLAFHADNDLRNNDLELATMITGSRRSAMTRPFLDPERSDAFAITPVEYEWSMQNYRDAVKGNRVLNWLDDHVALVRAADMLRVRLLRRLREPEAEHRRRDDYARRGVYFCDEAPEFSRAWDITRRIVMHLGEAVREDGGRLVVFTVPGEIEVDAAYRARVAESFTLDKALCVETTSAYAHLRSIASEAGADYIDLRDDFGAHVAAGGTLFLADRHWNAAAHRLAARRVADAIAGSFN